MGKIISIFNQKGGVGKTTTTVNLSAGIASLGHEILLIDLDPQANASSGLGVDPREKEVLLYDVLARDEDIRKGIYETTAKNLKLLPANNDLAGLEIELARINDWENLLRDKLEEIKDNYDYIFIDCPPSLGILSILSLVASDSIIVPIQSEYYALEGVSQLFDTFQLVKSNLNSDLELEGVLISMFDGRTNLAIEVVEEVKKYFKDRVYSTIIPRNVRLAEAPSHGLSIIDYDKKSRGAEAYMDLAEEFLARIQYDLEEKSKGVN